MDVNAQERCMIHALFYNGFIGLVLERGQPENLSAALHFVLRACHSVNIHQCCCSCTKTQSNPAESLSLAHDPLCKAVHET